MTNVLAVYENGVLRPKEPLELKEGQEVHLSFTSQPAIPTLREPAPEEQAYIARLKAAKSLQEMFAVMEEGPEEPDFDIMKAINESRRLTGFRMPDPEPHEAEG